MKMGMSIGKAIEVIGAIKIPSEIINSVEIAEALRMAMIALQKQIDIGQLLQEFIDDYKEENRYSERCVIEFLSDGYMLSEVNKNVEG